MQTPAQQSCKVRFAAVNGAFLLLAVTFIMTGCGEGDQTADFDYMSVVRAENAELFPVQINRPSGPPRVDTGMLDDLGRPVTVSCMSCHTTQTPNFNTRLGEDLTHFHHGLHMAHGGLSCLSCHNPENYNELRLVDGSPLAYPDVINLCAQCHMTQHRDYLHGAHGGMSGYWDRTRGPQTRLSCIDCHDPHAPQFPHMQPTFKARDRFLIPDHGDDH